MKFSDKIKVVQILNKIDMKNPKTTWTGVIAVIPKLLILFGVPIPTEVGDAFIALGVFIIGLVSKDHNTTGV